jgi:hypothetical protein
MFIQSICKFDVVCAAPEFIMLVPAGPPCGFNYLGFPRPRGGMEELMADAMARAAIICMGLFIFGIPPIGNLP